MNCAATGFEYYSSLERERESFSKALVYYGMGQVVDHLAFRNGRPIIEDEERRVYWTKNFVRHLEECH